MKRIVVTGGSGKAGRAIVRDLVDRPSLDLMAEVFPEVPIRKRLDEHETLLSIDTARSLIGDAPRWS
jgi:hypothetical protein